MSFAVYAIVRSGGRQHKVSVGDVLEVDRLVDEAGSTVELSAVLVVDGAKVTAEPAKLARCRITAEVLGETKGPKIDIMTYKSKSGYRRRLGHRQRYTQVKVTDIQAGGARTENKPENKSEKKPEEKPARPEKAEKSQPKATAKRAGKAANKGSETAGEKS